jgi:PBSX family phage terminase large subunit
MQMWQKNQLKRINLLEGSVSSGKTWISLVLWAFWVSQMPTDKLYMMTAVSLTTLKRNCLILLQELIGADNFDFSVSQKEGRLFGRRILLEGANDIRSEGKIRGLTLQGAYVDEATKMPRDFFAMLLSRLRVAGAKLIATTNPENPAHWLKTDYIDRADDLSMLVIKFLLDDNTTLPAEYVENIKREYTGVFYDRFILGKWVQAEGLIYPMWSNSLYTAHIGRCTKHAMSIDYGTQNAFAALLWGFYGGVWYLLREYYYSGRTERVQKTDEEYADDLDAMLDRYEAEEGEFLKPHERLLTIIDPSAASFIAVLRKRRRYKVLQADNDVLNGIRDTGSALHKGLLKLNPECKNTVSEIQNYCWDERSADDKPVKENDHAMDAMRYFCRTMRIAIPQKEHRAEIGGLIL